MTIQCHHENVYLLGQLQHFVSQVNGWQLRICPWPYTREEFPLQSQNSPKSGCHPYFSGKKPLFGYQTTLCCYSVLSLKTKKDCFDFQVVYVAHTLTVGHRPFATRGEFSMTLPHPSRELSHLRVSLYFIGRTRHGSLSIFESQQDMSLLAISEMSILASKFHPFIFKASVLSFSRAR